MRRPKSLAELRAKARRPAEELAVVLDYERDLYGFDEYGLPPDWQPSPIGPRPVVVWRTRSPKPYYVAVRAFLNYPTGPMVPQPLWRGHRLFTPQESQGLADDWVLAEMLEPEVDRGYALHQARRLMGPAAKVDEVRAHADFIEAQPQVAWFDGQAQRKAVQFVLASMSRSR